MILEVQNKQLHTKDTKHTDTDALLQERHNFTTSDWPLQYVYVVTSMGRFLKERVGWKLLVSFLLSGLLNYFCWFYFISDSTRLPEYTDVILD